MVTLTVKMNTTTPEIMAPAGDLESMLAAVAAGADAVYVGLKHFSARMQATNFSSSELARMANLARERGTKVYVAMNTLVKPGDMDAMARLMDRAERLVRPDALILSDLGAARIARQVGACGELHCSTLANLSHPAGLAQAKAMGFSRVVVPRELNLDEVRLMAEHCPDGLDLEIFVHGALCHNVSGRCWWSSFLGGKSGLRGRCVQPCRRLYDRPAKRIHPQRLFSCMDLSLDVLTKPLLDIPKVRAWKIEGRKKGPHYVFHTVKAYQLLRDEPTNAQAKKMAQDYLDLALGRPASHSLFLPQRPFQPVSPDKDTGSGKFIGKVKKAGKGFFFQPFEPLIPGDFLRIGYEDEPGHRTMKVRKSVPKGGRLDIPGAAKSKDKGPAFNVKGTAKSRGTGRNKGGKSHSGPAKGDGLAPGTRVFLIDRREPELTRLLGDLRAELKKQPDPGEASSSFVLSPLPRSDQAKKLHMLVSRGMPQARGNTAPAIWLSRSMLDRVPRGMASRVWWWLPPVIWPDEEQQWQELLNTAVKRRPAGFVLGAPWQRALFAPGASGAPDAFDAPRLIAGPFCNVSNAQAVAELAELGFEAAIVSPELAGEDALALPSSSPLPLGFVVKGMWPLGISRILAESVQLDEAYLSPHREPLFVKRYGQNNWLYPGWEVDFSQQRRALEQAGYRIFVTLTERWPKKVKRTERTSTFNWDNKLL